jgi:hypothetical protein
MSAEKADAEYYGCFGSAYLAPANGQPVSRRYLRIGSKVFWLEYRSDDNWRSNCGTVWIEYARPPRFLMNFVDDEPYPMLAIDFVRREAGLWAAIDYNTSPGLRHTPIEEDISGEEVVALIKEWMANWRGLGGEAPVSKYWRYFVVEIRRERLITTMLRDKLDGVACEKEMLLSILTFRHMIRGWVRVGQKIIICLTDKVSLPSLRYSLGKFLVYYPECEITEVLCRGSIVEMRYYL